ncbi:MAG: type II/IV secretion system protein, partial [Gammaproteobacteria bacterium]|nr:type II/IV secretion system protein [Gammaproteobacteria bacterium]
MRETEPGVVLVERLVSSGLISRGQLQCALKKKKSRDEPLGRLLVRLGLVSEGVLRATLGELTDRERIDLSTVIPDRDALRLVPKKLACRFGLLPISFDDEAYMLTVAMSDSGDVDAINRLAAALGSAISIATIAVSPAEIEAAIERFYHYDSSVPEILCELDALKPDDTNSSMDEAAYENALARLVDAILADSVERGASHIHLEPERHFLRVRYRIDGLLRQEMVLRQDLWPDTVATLKMISGLSITESRAPQTGRIRRILAGRAIDFDIASHAVTHGENVVLRVLDRHKEVMPLEMLGLSEDALASLQMMVARPEGIIVVVGPPGSGKTTTLYSMLNYRNDESVNIMTLENSVEYPMAMIRQSSISNSAQLDYASGIRSVMRQDADILVVGDIGGDEAAEMAFRAAMTGHQVFATLTCNSALALFPRLTDMGINPQTLAGNIIGVVAQRLVRRLCTCCKRDYLPSAAERKILGIGDSRRVRLHREGGCEACEFVGYKGRVSVAEILKIDEPLAGLAARCASQAEMYAVALESGFREVVHDAIRHVLDGTTSLSEISRVVDVTA